MDDFMEGVRLGIMGKYQGRTNIADREKREPGSSRKLRGEDGGFDEDQEADDQSGAE